MKLSDEELKKYSKMFSLPESVVKCISLLYDNRKEVEKNLYELGEEHISLDDEPEPESDENSDEGDIQEEDDTKKIENMLDSLGDLLEKYGFSPEDTEIKAFKMPQNLIHICPFNANQKALIDCNNCILHIKNLMPAAIDTFKEAQKDNKNMSLEEAIERIKFAVYTDTDYFFKKILEHGNNKN